MFGDSDGSVDRQRDCLSLKWGLYRLDGSIESLVKKWSCLKQTLWYGGCKVKPAIELVSRWVEQNRTRGAGRPYV